MTNVSVVVYPEDNESTANTRHIINFTQPRGSNVTDNGDGTVTLASTTSNTSQVWSDGITGDAGNKGNAFDGDINTTCDSANSGGVETETLTAALGITLNNETVELFAGHTYSGFYVTIDGVKQPTEYATTEKSNCLGLSLNLTSVSTNNGQTYHLVQLALLQ